MIGEKRVFRGTGGYIREIDREREEQLLKKRKMSREEEKE